MSKYIANITILFIICTHCYAWQSVLVQQDANGQLTYYADENGFKIPDFSHAGYMGGDADIPVVPVVRTISPITGDNTAHIQAAIDAVGALPQDANGIRGALLLQAGKYAVSGTLYVPYSGVVIRGIGSDENTLSNTIIYATGDIPHQRDVLVIGNSEKRVWGGAQTSETKQNIVDNILLPDETKITVTDGSIYSVGQELIIYHPCSNVWLQAINYGGVPYPDPSDTEAADERWTENQYPITLHRYIKSINGNQIELDAPLFYTFNKSLSQSYVYVPKMAGTYYKSGVENLRIEIESAGGEDENHAWQALRFRSCENMWTIQCTFKGFGQSGIITEACRRSSFINCKAIDPVGIVTGERMYNFNTYLNSQLNLFQNCYASHGRHHYISNGTSGTSGNVFLNCVSDGVQSVNEGHRGWTQGMLYDNHTEINKVRAFTLGLYNRVTMGTGHGWAAVQSVLWNCDVNESSGIIGLQKPPTAQNYAIGCHAKTITGNPVSASNFTRGYVEGQNQTGLEPQSLYLAQLQARKNATVTHHNAMQKNENLLYNANDKTLLVKQTCKTIRLISIKGMVIMDLQDINALTSISLKQYASGMYIVESQSNEATHNQKIFL